MALTPVEIRHMTPGTGLFGYKRAAMDRLLDEIAASFEDVWRERADLADKIEQLETDLVRYRELEALLAALDRALLGLGHIGRVLGAFAIEQLAYLAAHP